MLKYGGFPKDLDLEFQGMQCGSEDSNQDSRTPHGPGLKDSVAMKWKRTRYRGRKSGTELSERQQHKPQNEKKALKQLATK